MIAAYLWVIHHSETAANQFRCKVNSRPLEEGHRDGVHVNVRWTYRWVREVTEMRRKSAEKTLMNELVTH